MKLRIGTRKSPLALAQANLVKALLSAAHEVEIIPISTTGDQMLAGPLTEIGGKGLFTKELEEALLDGQIDLAVHSAKDMQTVLPPGLMLACVPKREDARDVLIGAPSIAKLPKNCILGSASLRRAAQVLHVRPDVRVATLRGNVQTRLNKIEAGEAQATLLALAGLTRLGMNPLPGTVLSLDEMLPAPAQGALGIESRADDEATRAALAPLNDAASFTAVVCERALLAAVDGSCRTPVAAYAEVQGGEIYLRAKLLSPDGAKCWSTEARGQADDTEILGKMAGEKLLALQSK